MNQRDAYAPLDYLKKYILQKPIYLSTRGSHKTLTKNIPVLPPPPPPKKINIESNRSIVSCNQQKNCDKSIFLCYSSFDTFSIRISHR